MPLERRVQPPRTYQRQRRGNIRHHPYHFTRCLHDSRTGEEIQALPSENAQTQISFKAVTKRPGYGKYTYIARNGSMPTIAAHSNSLPGVEVEEAQRLSPNQRAQTDSSRPSRRRRGRGEEQSSLAFRRVDRSHNCSPSIRDISSTSATSSSELTSSDDILLSMNPNAVPTTTPSSSSRSYSPLPIISSDRLSHGDIHNFSAPSSSSLGDDNTSELKNPCSRASYKYCAHDVRQDWSTSLAASLCRSRGSFSGMAPTTAHARQVASRVIRHARENKTPDERCLWCPDCRRLPVLPVTGPCGHTRCTRCIEAHGDCPCGIPAPKSLHVNTVVQDLTWKMTHAEKALRDAREPCAHGSGEQRRTARKPAAAAARLSLRVRSRSCLSGRSRLRIGARPILDVPPETPLTSQARFELAYCLLGCGRLLEAAPHFARVAATSLQFARAARTQLTQIITALSNGRDPRRLTRALYRAVRAQAASCWLRPTDLECVLCYHPYTSPVTTPCGHTYCRTCIERSMDYRKACALCLRALDDFDLANTRETGFVCAALASIDALSPPAPPDPDVIPIFVCTVAYPAIPCPLFIFDPRYWLMIRRVLESGSRKFGMVAYERDRSYSDYGTVLEVCDCVQLEDGRSILSTVGVSRFRVIKRDVIDGCDVARIQPLTDITPTEELLIWEIRLLATQISYKALLWLNTMNQTVRSEIKAAFGWLPHLDRRQEWWLSPDGPAWLWWLIAILPLRSEIKVLILSTKNLLKRMLAVSRTLEAIDQVSFAIPAATSECGLGNALTEWM